MIDKEIKKELSGIWAALVATLFLLVINSLATLALMQKVMG